MSSTEASTVTADEYEVNLFDLAGVLLKRRYWIAQFTAGITVLSVVMAFLLPSSYQSTTKVMPPQQGQSGSSAALAQLGALVTMGGGPQKNPSDLYAATLQVDPV